MKRRKGVACATAVAGVVASLLAFEPAAGAAPEGSPAPGVKGALPAPPANGEMGFVFTDLAYAVYPGLRENCPNGAAADLRQDYLATLPADERARLLRPENEKELGERRNTYAFGPNNTNVCSQYDQFPERPLLQSTIQSNIAYGLDLDGDDGSSNPNVCSHQSFTSPTGERGIDNQTYRVLGCWNIWRRPDGSPGEVTEYGKREMASGSETVVMLLRGVRSLERDDDVEVIVASTLDLPVFDTHQNILPDTSFTVSDNPRWRNVLKGKIVAGVLTTRPADISLRRSLPLGGAAGRKVEFKFYDARLRLEMKPDGSLDGLLGAYEPLTSAIQPNILAGRATAVSGNINCASMYNTMKKYADGRRDPKTGACTAISSARHVTAVPAFVFDRPPQAAQSTSAAK